MICVIATGPQLGDRIRRTLMLSANSIARHL